MQEALRNSSKTALMCRVAAKVAVVAARIQLSAVRGICREISHFYTPLPIAEIAIPNLALVTKIMTGFLYSGATPYAYASLSVTDARTTSKIHKIHQKHLLPQRHPQRPARRHRV